MRIAVIGSRGVPAQYSGVERAVEEVARRLVGKGHSVTVFCRKTDYLFKKYQGIERTVVPTIDNKNLGTFIHVGLSTMMVLFTKADVVHYHALGPSFFALLPRLLGKKVVVTIHALDWQRRKWGWFAKFFLFFCQLTALYFPHRTVVVSRDLREYYKKRFNRDVMYIPNGVDVNSFVVGIAQAARPQDNSRYFLFVGRLVPEKRLADLILAVNSLSEDVRLMIAGELNEKDKYVRMLLDLAGERVCFLGPKDIDGLKLLYANACAVVLPSEVEGAPLVLLEAMAFGKCVVASNLPACVEILGNDAVYFNVGDRIDLQSKLEVVLKDPVKTAEIGRKARERVRIMFDWDKISEDMVRLYSSLSSEGQSHG